MKAPALLRPEQRSRTRRFDEAVEGLRDDLSNDIVRKRLGGYALDLDSLVSRVYLPNVSTSRLVTPREHQDDGIPVVPVINNKPMRFSSTLDMPTVGQLQRIQEMFKEQYPGNPAEADLFAVAALSETIRAIQASADSSVRWNKGHAGTLQYKRIDMDFGSGHVYSQFTRPSVILQEEGPLTKLTLGHELLHVKQHETDPVVVKEVLKDTIGGMELEANHLATHHIAGLRATDEWWHDLPLLNEEKIEAIRKKHSPDNFTLTEPIIDDLKQAQLDHAVWRDLEEAARQT